MSIDDRRTERRRNIAENFNSTGARTLHSQTDDRRQTDGRTMTYSEREREFTFAKNCAICIAFQVQILGARLSIMIISSVLDMILYRMNC